MLRLTAIALAGVVATVGVAGTALAHALHTTHTTLRATPDGYTLTVRAFADDLSASVARFGRRPTPPDSSVAPGHLLAYASSRLLVTGDAGGSLPLQSCGLRRVQDAYLACFRIPRASSLRIDNRLLTELHPDQVNIVQCEGPRARRTFMFTRGRPPAHVVIAGECATR